MTLETVAIALVCLAAVLLLVAGGLAFAKRRFLMRAAHADGTVTALRGDEPIEIGGKAQMLRPVIRFTTPQGVDIEFVMAMGSTPPRYRVGDTVPVRYEPSNPAATARVDSFLGLWLVPTLLGGLASPALAVGIGLLLWQTLPARDLVELRRTGNPLTGVVAQIDHDSASQGPDGKPMYVLSIEAEEPQSGQRLTFTSEPISADLRNAYTIGDKVQVIVDPADPAHYVVDLK